MPAGLNRWPTANLRLRRRAERLLEPTRNRGMKSEGLHLKKEIIYSPTRIRKVRRINE
jgi:hypothetical protein